MKNNLQKLKTLIAIGTFKQNKKGMKIRMEEKSFEENMEQLEKIVTELEKGDLNLDESVKKFEQGMKISKKCNDILENAEKKITILLKQENGIKEENFETEE